MFIAYVFKKLKILLRGGGGRSNLISSYAEIAAWYLVVSVQRVNTFEKKNKIFRTHSGPEKGLISNTGHNVT